MKTPVQSVSVLYGNKVRVRACGICIEEGRILLVNHSIYKAEFWSPPGGGVEFGESVTDTLIREFKEETGLNIEVGEMLFMHEFIQPPLHAIELFFNISCLGGKLITGVDPEFSGSDQIIQHVSFLNMQQIRALPENSVHTLFKRVLCLEDILKLSGFI